MATVTAQQAFVSFNPSRVLQGGDGVQIQRLTRALPTDSGDREPASPCKSFPEFVIGLRNRKRRKFFR